MKLQKIWTSPLQLPATGGRPKKEKPATPAERSRKHRKPEKEKQARHIGVIDSETDPFDNVSQAKILPFLFVVYTDEREPIVLWDENFTRLIKRLIAALESFEEPYTWYAHNGGKFDYMFLIHELRGEVSFKGRGIMEAKLGIHTLRDSFHIINEPLAAYQKDAFDYSKLKKASRAKHKAEAVSYCIADCRYLLDLVKGFVGEYGLKLSTGQAAMAEIKKHYTITPLRPGWDEYLRTFFYGGRVECLKGRGDFRGAYRLYDVNSMYPYVMAHRRHPIGGMDDYNMRVGAPGPDTVFIDLNCDNRGALIARTDEGETTANIKSGRFYTTIWEYETALKYGLISNVEINFCLDCPVRTDFSKFVLPLYNKRQLGKKILADLKRDGLEGTAAFMERKKLDIYYKLILNTGYGKFAQNPRSFKEHYLTDPGEQPPAKWLKSLDRLPPDEQAEYMLPAFEGGRYWIWIKPAPGWRFNNVGTAASITGAARAVLLDAIHNSIDPIYCDTDSLICRELRNVTIHKEELGAWDIEDEFSRVIVNGKKLYSCYYAKPKTLNSQQLANGQRPEYKIRTKGTAGLTWADMENLLQGGEKIVANKGPTLTKFGTQKYISRTIRATAPLLANASYGGQAAPKSNRGN